MNKSLFWLILIIFISSCTPDNCMIEKRDYSCKKLKVNDTFFEDENIKIQNIEYESDGLIIKGMIASPKPVENSSLILFNHGGKEGIMEINWIKALAYNGYTVFASHYRGEGGSQGRIEVALGETTDIMNLLECGKLIGKEFLPNGENIGVLGFSHGAALTLQAMELSDDFKAGAAFWPPADIKKRFMNIQGENDPILPWIQAVGNPDEKDVEEELMKRSALYCVNRINAPLLLFHGKQDNIIPYPYALDLTNELDKAGKQYEFRTYDNLGHEFRDISGQKDTETEEQAILDTIEWFDKYLK